MNDLTPIRVRNNPGSYEVLVKGFEPLTLNFGN
jgi:hypothetical protein